MAVRRQTGYQRRVFTNRRSCDGYYWELEAYDAMRKADVVWKPDQSLNFPMTMPDAVNIFAS